MSSALLLFGASSESLAGETLPIADEETFLPIIQRLQSLFDSVVAIAHRPPANRGRSVLDGERWAPVLLRGTASQLDLYSALSNDEHCGNGRLTEWLRERNITDLYLAGFVAADRMQSATLDALRAGFHVHLVVDACRGREPKAASIERSIEELRAAGVHVLHSRDLLAPPPEVLHQTKFLNLVQRGNWVYATRPHVSGIVTIAAVTADDRLLLVEQYRAPIGATVIELPAGLAGDDPAHQGEKLLEAARRELLEETGYVADELEEIVTTATSAGMTDEAVTIFVARGLKKRTEGGGVAGERILLHEVPLAEVDAWLHLRSKAGVLVDGRVFAGLYFLQKSRSR